MFFFKISFYIRDYRQITFVMLNEFCLLTKKTPPLVFNRQFLVNFLGYTRLNLTNLLINLLGLSLLNLSLFLCEGHQAGWNTNQN